MIGLNKLQNETGVYVFEIISLKGIHNKEIKEGDIIVERPLQGSNVINI
jgi:hypothetical protein